MPTAFPNRADAKKAVAESSGGIGERNDCPQRGVALAASAHCAVIRVSRALSANLAPRVG